MIEGRRLPNTGGVAACASMRKIRCSVIGIDRALKIGLMARETIRRCAGELVVHVTLRTHHGEMRAGERKARAIVVEIGGPPAIEGVAHLAIARKIAGDVIRICRFLKIGLMARPAIFRRSREFVVEVALGALDGAMRAGQRKSRALVIEARRLPGVIAVANLTILGKIAGHVIRVRGFLKICLMAGKTIRRRAGKTIVRVTLVAGGRRVRAEQRKTRAAVIETAEIARAGNLPTGDRAAVAYFAAQRKTGELVIRIGGGFVILSMANPALQRHIDKPAFALRSVAIVATNVLVPAQQRETSRLMHHRHF